MAEKLFGVGGGPSSSGYTTTVCGLILIIFAALKLSCNKLFTHHTHFFKN